MNILLSMDPVNASPGMSGIVMVVYFAVIIGFFYFMLFKPQKKEKKRIESMLSSLAIGDSVLTTSGFYGMVIDINEEMETVIVEFGNNKNCRIPMNKSAIAQVEKPDAN